MESLKIYHKDWNDNLFIQNNNYIYRESNNDEKGLYFIIDKLLLINWEKWKPEIFIKDGIICDEGTNNSIIKSGFRKSIFKLLEQQSTFCKSSESAYEQALMVPAKNNNYYLFDTLNINTIYLIHSDWHDNIILDIELKKLYRKNDIKINGSFTFKKNKLYIKWESLGIVTDENINGVFRKVPDEKPAENFIYFDFKYYEEKLFLKDYEIIKIYESKLNSKDYLLSKNCSEVFEDYLSSNKIGKYIKYKNKLSIFFNVDIKYKIFYKYESNIYYSYQNNKNNFDLKIINSESILKKDGIKIIIGFLDIYNIINYIDFLNNYICIILDKSENKSKNNIYDDLNILYYDVNKEYEHIIQKCKDHIKNIDENYNIEIIDFKKIEQDTELNLLMIGKNDLKNDNDIIKKKWYMLNKDKMEKYQHILDIYGTNKEQYGIPKIFHFIWIGPNEFPKESNVYIESWKKLHPDYMFCFWNDTNIPLLYNQSEYNNSKIMAMKADILRYELLYIFGGIYVDCDFMALKNIEQLIIPNGYIGFSGYECKKYIAIGLMGFCSEDIVLHNIIKYLSLNIKIHKDAIQKNDIPRLSGPKYFTEMWDIYKTDLHHAFSPEYFYSYTFEDKLYGREYQTTENNYAIHFWNHSWKIN
jgi:mannosyltransferase OCH1-like enzyme